MDQLLAYLSQQVLTNHFFSGAALAGMLLGVLNYVRLGVVQLYQFIKAWFTIRVTVHSQDELYVPLNIWLFEKGNFDRFAKSYRVRSENGEPRFGPNYGEYWMRALGKWWRVATQKEEAPAMSHIHDRVQTKDFLTLTYYGISKKPLERLFNDVQELQKRKLVDDIPLFQVDNDGCYRIGGLSRRSAHRVVLKSGLLEWLEQDIADFLNKRLWYEERGLGFRRGYLLYGPPGTGKTSVVRHLARRFDLNVCAATNLPKELYHLPKRSILLLEDIDCMMQARAEEEDQPKPSVAAAATSAWNDSKLGQFLNALDGLKGPEEVVVIATTNHPEKLDKAFLRPGRIDVKLEFGYCDTEQAGRLFSAFFPDADLAAFTDAFHYAGQMTPAEVQEVLLRAADAGEAVSLIAEREEQVA